MKPNWLQMTEPQSCAPLVASESSRRLSRALSSDCEDSSEYTMKKSRKLAQSMTFHRLQKYSAGPEPQISMASSMMNHATSSSATNIHVFCSSSSPSSSSIASMSNDGSTAPMLVISNMKRDRKRSPKLLERSCIVISTIRVCRSIQWPFLR